MIHGIFQFELEVTRKDGYGSADNRKCLLDLIANHSPNDEDRLGQQDVQSGTTNAERSLHIGHSNQIKSLTVALEIVKDILPRSQTGFDSLNNLNFVLRVKKS